jgi:hypothetical protein
MCSSERPACAGARIERRAAQRAARACAHVILRACVLPALQKEHHRHLVAARRCAVHRHVAVAVLRRRVRARIQQCCRGRLMAIARRLV